MTYQIRKGVPLPEKGVPLFEKGVHRPSIPFDQLEVGDSILIECEPNDINRVQQWVSSRAATHARLFGKKFTTRKEASGVGVWRIS